MKLAKLALLLLFITFCIEDNDLSIENNADKASGEIFPAKKVSTILYKV